MKPRFIKWILLLLLLTIAATEGLRGPGSRADEGNVLAVRARGSSRFSSRKSGSSESTSEGTPQTADTKSTTPKASRFSSPRKATLSKNFGRHSTSAPSNGSSNSGSSASATSVNKSTTEHSLSKSRIEAALQRRADKLKAQKPLPHGLVRPLPNRKLGQKNQTPEPEKLTTSNPTEVVEEGDESEDRRYLPDGLSEEAKNAKEEEDVEGFEAPKGGETQTGSQKNVRFNTANRSKQKQDGNNPLDNSRSRTGRKIQNQVVLSPKQLKSNVPTSSRFPKVKESDEESEVESTTDTIEAGSIRRSFEVEPPVFRKKPNDKPDISVSGSESVRINIPLNFEESKKLGGPSRIDEIANEAPKKLALSNLRFKSRGRTTLDDKKIDLETSSSTTTTLSTPIRGAARRVKGNKGHESSTEATTARTRGRTFESRKSNTIADSTSSSSSTTVQPDFRRRNFKQKAMTRTPESNVVFEVKSTHNTNSQNSNFDNKKPNRLRGRYRADVTTVSTSPTVSNTAFIHPTVGLNYGAITPSYVPEVVITTTQPPTSSVPTTARYSVQPPTVPTTTNVEAIRKNEEGEDGSQENGQKRRSSKEDFFNHGLGFRGRRPPIPGAPEATPVAITSTTVPATIPTTIPRLDNSARGNPGWTLRRRPGHWNDGQISGPSANPAETIPPVEQDGRTITTTLETTVTDVTTQKAPRRGNKAFTKVSNSGGKQDENSENDNYPPDFKERIAQLQKTGAPPKTQTEEPQLQTSSNVTGSASADLELAPSENEYLLVTQTAHPISSTTLSLQIPSNLEEQQVRDT